MNEITFKRIFANHEEAADEEWILTAEMRHDKFGFRAQRYARKEILKAELKLDFTDPIIVNMIEDLYQNHEDNTLIWDENNMFFFSIEDAYKAFNFDSKELRLEGRKNF